MADVFLSYKRDERAAVETIASRLRDLGLTVWFDASMSAGETFNAEIDREARAAKAILVCWSPAARQSEWVNAEAMIGFEQKKLAACYVAGPDRFSAPTPFNTTHAEDLRVWLTAPSVTHPGWKGVLRRLGKLCGRADVKEFGALDTLAPTSVLRRWILAHNSSPLLLTVDELLRARDVEEGEYGRREQEAGKRVGRETEARRDESREQDREPPIAVLQNVELSIGINAERCKVVDGAVIALYREVIRVDGVDYPLSEVTCISAYPGMMVVVLTQERMISVLATYRSIIEKLNPGPIQEKFQHFAARLSEKTFSYRLNFLATFIRNHGEVVIGLDGRNNQVTLTLGGMLGYCTQEFDPKQAQTFVLGLDADQDVVTCSARPVQPKFLNLRGTDFFDLGLRNGILRFALSNANRDVIWNLLQWLAQPGNKL